MKPTYFAALIVGLAALGAFGCASTAPEARGPAASEPPAPAVPPPASPEPAPSKTGPEGAACGGIAGFGCAAKLYCAFPIDAHCGAADQMGKCRVVPEVCTEEFDPVCGCNDKAYPNACAAARDGVSVAKAGSCGAAAAVAAIAEGQICGTRGVPGECADGLYCAFKSDCGQTDAGGVCTKKPQICTKIYAPVCGCDSKTYASDCSAAAAGASVAAKGACKPQ